MPKMRFTAPLLCVLLTLAVSADAVKDVGSLLQKGDPKAALERSTSALSTSPGNPRLRFLKGVALAELNRTEEAIEVFSSLTRDQPDLPEPYNNLAVLYAQQGQLEKAQVMLQKALQTNAAYATAQSNLTSVYGKLASQAYDKALQLDRSAPAAPPAARLAMVKDIVNGSTPPALASTPGPAPKPVTPVPASKPLPAQPGTPSPTVLASGPTSAPTPVPAATATPSARPPEPKPIPPPTAKPPVLAAPAAAQPVVAPPAASPKPVLPAATPGTPVADGKPAAPATASPVASPDETPQITQALQGWAAAWTAKKVNVYLGYYSKEFKTPDRLSRSAWEQQRRERIEAARKIDVRLDGFKIRQEGERATVRFVQHYRSERLNSSVGKTVVLERVGKQWLILEERIG